MKRKKVNKIEVMAEQIDLRESEERTSRAQEYRLNWMIRGGDLFDQLQLLPGQFRGRRNDSEGRDLPT